MRTLIVGAGAVGGILATRLLARGADVSLATRRDTAATLIREGLGVTGKGGDAEVRVPASAVTTVPELLAAPSKGGFELVILATRAPQAEALAPTLLPLLSAHGTLLPLQTGGVVPLLAERLGTKQLIGGMAEFTADMYFPGRYEQLSEGGLLIGELPAQNPSGAAAADITLDKESAGGVGTKRDGSSLSTTAKGREDVLPSKSIALTPRVARIAEFLATPALPVRTTSNMIGAIWSRLALDCAGTTLAALNGSTARDLVATRDGVTLFAKAYAEVRDLATKKHITLEPITGLSAPYPPAWSATIAASYPSAYFMIPPGHPLAIDSVLETGGPGEAYLAWLTSILAHHGDTKPRMIEDLIAGGSPEVEYLNGYVVDQAAVHGESPSVNLAVTKTVHVLTHLHPFYRLRRAYRRWTRRPLTPGIDLLESVGGEVFADEGADQL